MKKIKLKILSVFICFIAVVLSIGSVSVLAENEKKYAEAEDIINGIVFLKQSDGDVNAFIEKALSENAGISSEWYVLALSQYGSYDFSSYEEKLLDYLSKNKVSSPATRLKYALCLASVGSRDPYIEKTLGDSVGKQGIMSYIFGLHLLNNGYENENYSKDSLLSEILSKQLPNGGWAVSGENADADVTAMALQALAIYYKDNAEVKASVEKALSFLSEIQTSDGGFKSYGIENPESSAQVIIALSSLGIDFSADKSFIKNGNTLLDGIKKFRLSDGSFCHKEGGTSNETSTSQVLCALVSYIRFSEGKTPFYLLDGRRGVNTEDIFTESDTEKASETEPESGSEASPEDGKGTFTIKTALIVAVITISVLICVLLVFLGKTNVKNFIVVIIITAASVMLLAVTDISSADDYYNGAGVSKENPVGKATITIRCDEITDKNDSEYIPDDGIILPITEFDIAEEDTVYDILVEAARKFGIRLENDGGDAMPYISGINYIYEFDFGELSGWICRVNGELISVGCGEYKLSDGDNIEWIYTTDFGRNQE